MPPAIRNRRDSRPNGYGRQMPWSSISRKKLSLSTSSTSPGCSNLCLVFRQGRLLKSAGTGSIRDFVQSGLADAPSVQDAERRNPNTLSPSEYLPDTGHIQHESFERLGSGRTPNSAVVFGAVELLGRQLSLTSREGLGSDGLSYFFQRLSAQLLTDPRQTYAFVIAQA